MPSENVDVILRMRGSRQFAGEATRASRGVEGIGKASQRAAARSQEFSGTLRSVGRAAKVGAAVGIGALATEVFRATKGYSDHVAVQRRTQAVIKSTGGAASVTADHVGRLSNAIERQTGVDGDLIQGGANLLLTFTNVRNGVGRSNQIFDRATSTVTNMSKALGQDTKSSAIQLGKALNDPVKGITALQRVGVSFTADQQKQIESLVKSGHSMKAQKIILRELGKEFPKVKTAPLERLQVTLRSLEDVLGKVLLPIFNRGVRALNRFAREALAGTGTGGKFVGVMKDLGGRVREAVGWVRHVVELWKQGDPAVTALVTAIAALTTGIVIFRTITALTRAWAAAQVALDIAMDANPLVLVAALVAALAAAIYIGYKRSAAFRRIVNAVWGALKTAAGVVRSVAIGAFQALWAVLRHAPLVMIIRHFHGIIDFIRSMPGKITSAASGMWDGIKNAFKGAINWIIGAWNSLEFHIPGFDPPGPGPKFGGVTIGVPDIPLLARGGTITGGGAAIVGERGPELVTLPRSASVFPAANVAPLGARPGLDPSHAQPIITRVYLDRRQIAEAIHSYDADKRARR